MPFSRTDHPLLTLSQPESVPALHEIERPPIFRLWNRSFRVNVPGGELRRPRRANRSREESYLPETFCDLRSQMKKS